MFAQKTLLPPRIDAVFHAATPEMALALAKRALGSDALVLATNTFQGPEGPRVELIASNSPGVGLPSLVLSQPPLPQFGMEPGTKVASPLERLLRLHDVPLGLARELVLKIGDPQAPRSALLEPILRLIRTTVGFGDGARGGHRVLALVGPTGVGKTTTIAKLAAHEALVQRRKVALVSLDDFRVGGAEQLARYAELLDAPFSVARDEAALAKVLEQYRGFDRIYVDTAGRSAKERTPRTLERLLRLVPDAGVGLTLAAGTRTAELEQGFRLHLGEGSPKPSFLVLTKLDEAVLGGAALVATHRTRLPIAWVTNGQRVPEDIEPARAEHVASLLAAEVQP